MSPSFNYVKNQVLLGKFSKEDLITLQNRGIITEAERLELETLI